jgi:hypothetical protein
MKPMSSGQEQRTAWTAHNEPWLWPTLFVGAVLLGWWVSPFMHPAVAVAPFILFAWYINACGHRHQSMFCFRCWRAQRGDPAVAVLKHRRALWWAHVVERFGVFLLIPSLVLVFIPQRWVALAGIVTLVLIASCGSWSLVKHKQLLPWCPRCPRHGGGGWGGSALVVPPTPVMTGAR